MATQCPHCRGFGRMRGTNRICFLCGGSGFVDDKPAEETSPAIPEDVNASAKEYADGFYPIKDYSCYESDYDYRTQVAKNEQVQEHYKAGAAHIQKQGEDSLTVSDYEEVLRDHRALVRELDVIINGKDAAKQASLCDIVAQLRSQPIPSSIVRRLEEMRDKIFELAEKETDDFQRTVYFSHGSDINIASQLITKYASILLSAQPAEQGENMEQLAKEIWKMAMIYANNLCVGLSDDFNNDDEIVEASAASRCANLMKSEMNHPHPDVIVYAKKYNKSSPGGDYKLPGFDETMQQLQTLTIQPKKEDKS